MDATKEAELRAALKTAEDQLSAINHAIWLLEKQRWFIIERKDNAQRELRKAGT